VRQGLSRPLWLALVIFAFCLPLFIGLGRTDVENDEGIYSFAVDQILVNGDWLNPRASPNDDLVFLEKPPLKFWIVALPIRLGLLPHNEVGLRFWDALFGAVAFLYVFAIGRRLAGAVCGLIGVMILFVDEPLLFEHGLRGNNMEAPLFLCYCAGIYHYIAWGTSDDVRRRRRHIFAVALSFSLGFMTKFVAALFLPVVLAAAGAMVPEVRRRLMEDVKIWLAAAGLVFALVAPWFVYQQLTTGNAVWSVMFGTHVFQRFTTSLDVSHLRPWYYYWLEIWKGLVHYQIAWLAVAGFALLLGVSVRQRRLEQLTVIAWLVLPLGLMSFGSSKLPHYAYPFLPAVALATGFGPGWVAQTGAGYLDRIMGMLQGRLTATGEWSRMVRRVLLSLSVVALGIALLTLVFGAVNWRVGGAVILRNTHYMRPLLVALVLATLGGRGVMAGRVILPAALLMLVLPMNGYEDVLRRAKIEAHPLRSARDCFVSVRAAQLSAGAAAPGLYAIGEHRWFLHSYFYYLHHVGGWERTETLDDAALSSALFEPGRQRPVLIGEPEYRAFKLEHEAEVQLIPVLALRDVLLLMPGPYAACEVRPSRRMLTLPTRRS
jgi:4-amino-4-deoxy-L-arabinose transferase-like glycosyltransferase